MNEVLQSAMEERFSKDGRPLQTGISEAHSFGCFLPSWRFDLKMIRFPFFHKKFYPVVTQLRSERRAEP
jgi:hypothetical protein